MGVYTFTIIDETSSAAPARLFKALCIDNHNLFPKVVPHIIKSIDVEGDIYAVGSIKQFNFAEGSPYKYVKGRLDMLDVDNHHVKYTNFEGDVLNNLLECVVYESKIESSGSGSHYKMVGHFHTKGDAVVTEEAVKGGLLSMQMTYKAVDEYLSNNPQYA
ncbi:major allergen Mal d 1 [Beta vulgaris subsp. vulgaris]|uniref:major allergen Mal d 1 n=1 Tax=Beta vulgaris subsp. vulgaris TaxID=3555 RepID=UPI00203762CF|nr:major allergen Mal d 1 [Beta vulgaris subsp. vulgaris]